MAKKTKKALLEKWQNATYDESVKAFRTVFGYDYTTGIPVSKELNLMDRDVKKASLSKLRELNEVI